MTPMLRYGICLVFFNRATRMRVALMAGAGLAALWLSSAATASPHLLFGEPVPVPPAPATLAPAHPDSTARLHATLASIQSQPAHLDSASPDLASAAQALRGLTLSSTQAPSLQGHPAQSSASRPAASKPVTDMAAAHAIDAMLAMPRPATQARQIVTYDARTPCWEAAAARHGVDPWLLYATAYVESRYSPDAISGNTNGTVDMGLMQVNSTWLPTLSKYGITRATLMNACASTYIGAWIMAQNFRRYGYSWKAIAAYNVGSLDTPRRERIGYDYARKVYAAYDMLSTDPAAVRRLMAGHPAASHRRVYAEHRPPQSTARQVADTASVRRAVAERTGQGASARGSVPVGLTPNAGEVASALHP